MVPGFRGGVASQRRAGLRGGAAWLVKAIEANRATEADGGGLAARVPGDDGETEGSLDTARTCTQHLACNLRVSLLLVSIG